MVSIPTGLENDVTRFLTGRKGKPFVRHCPILIESDEELTDSMGQIQRMRYAAEDRVPMKVRESAAQTGFYISRTPVMMEGRIELLQYVQNQSICDTYHRYGNIGERGLIEA